MSTRMQGQRRVLKGWRKKWEVQRWDRLLRRFEELRRQRLLQRMEELREKLQDEAERDS